MSFSQATKDKINGWGSVMRFITPILVTIMLFILSGIKTDIKDMEEYSYKRFEKIDLQFERIDTKFSTHLNHHLSLETLLSQRLSTIETIIDKKHNV
jgi:hypothetical protein